MATRKSRTYQKRKRADAEQETRSRITKAAVELHGTVGPAKSTVTDVAKLAGVSRMTVYNHFPTEVDLFKACSSHWADEHPFPDPLGWTDEDPSRRLGSALAELYAWYSTNRDMLANVLRDVPTVPALAEVMVDLWGAYMKAAAGALARGWSTDALESDEFHATLQLALDFHTWQALTGSALTDDAAAELMARLVAHTARDGLPPGTSDQP